jgi:hypothetical protein
MHCCSYHKTCSRVAAAAVAEARLCTYPLAFVLHLGMFNAKKFTEGIDRWLLDVNILFASLLVNRFW